MKLSVKLLLIYVGLTFGLTAVALLWAKNHVTKSFDAIESSMDDIQDRTFTTEGLDVLEVNGPFDIVYHQGKGQSRISGPGILVKEFDLSINEGILKISTKRAVIPKGLRISIDIYGSKISEIQLRKNVNFSSADTLQLSDAFTLTHSGSGNVEFSHNPVDNIEIYVNGVPEVTLYGKTNTLDVSINGTSSAHLTGLIANTGKVSVSGSSEAFVHVTEMIDISANGSSEVGYVDTGARVKANASGASRVDKIASDSINSEPASSESDK